MVDDLIAYLHDDDHVLLVPNAANTAEVRRRLEADAPEGVTITDQHETHAVLAVQGPKSDEVLAALGLPTGHDYMSFEMTPFDGAGRRGLPHRLHRRARLRARRTERGRTAAVGRVARGGGGARHASRAGSAPGTRCAPRWATRCTARTSASTITPNQARLGWAVGWSKPAFWGKEPLRRREGGRVRRDPARPGRPGSRHRPAADERASSTGDLPVGHVTSGTFSPTLRKGIALALLNSQVQEGAEVLVDVRGRAEVFVVTTPPFVETDVRES